MIEGREDLRVRFSQIMIEQTAGLAPALERPDRQSLERLFEWNADDGEATLLGALLHPAGAAERWIPFIVHDEHDDVAMVEDHGTRLRVVPQCERGRVA